MKKVLVPAGAIGMAFLLSACLFVMRSFTVEATSLSPGQSTNAKFELRPYSTAKVKAHQFVMVGTDDSADLAIGKATWGTNGKFTGPAPMTVEPALPGLLTTPAVCSSNGLDLSTMTGITFKGFMTATPVANKGAVDQKAITKVALKAKAAAGLDEAHTVVGVTGVWEDNESGGTLGTPDAEDTFICTGIATSNVYVK